MYRCRDADVLVTILTALGAVEIIAFEKHCTNYRFTARDRYMLATVVAVPELDGETFVELETPADPDEVTAALDDVRAVLAEVGVTVDDYTTELYADAVAGRRGVSL